jgi:hypothetical protein
LEASLYQARQTPVSLNLMTAKSARAAVEAAKPSANTPITKANFFIFQLPKDQPIWFDSTELDILASPRAADASFTSQLQLFFMESIWPESSFTARERHA